MAGLMATGQKTCRDSAAAVRRVLCVAGVLTLAVAILLVSLPQVASADMAGGVVDHVHDCPDCPDSHHETNRADQADAMPDCHHVTGGALAMLPVEHETALNGSFRYLHDRPTSVTGRHRSPERDLPPPRA